MRLRKLAAAATAAAMLGSLAAAVPASAKTVEGEKTVTAALSAQVRGDSWTGDPNSNSSKEVKDGAAIEVNNGTYMGAYYSFESLALPEDAVITSATLSVKAEKKGVRFDVLPAAAYTAYHRDNIWEAVKTAIADNKSKLVYAAAATADGGNTTADVKDIISTADTFAFLVYNSYANNAYDSGKRNVYADATLTVAYTYESAVAEVNGQSYKTFADAYNAVEAGGTIKLLDDVTLEGRQTIDKATTITGENKTITVTKSGNNGDILIKDNVTFDGVNITTATQLKIDVDNKTLTVKNSEVKGGIYLGKVNGTLVLDSADVDKVTTRNGSDAAATVTKNTVSGSANIGELVYYSDTDVIDDALTVTTKTDTYVAPVTIYDKYFTFTLEKASYNTAKITLGDGKVGTKSITQITGPGSVTYGITEIPEGTTITGMVLEGILND